MPASVRFREGNDCDIVCGSGCDDAFTTWRDLGRAGSVGDRGARAWRQTTVIEHVSARRSINI
jgi:hypothetical protein